MSTQTEPRDLIPSLTRTLDRHAANALPDDRLHEIERGALTLSLTGDVQRKPSRRSWLAAAAVVAVGAVGIVAVAVSRDEPSMTPATSPVPPTPAGGAPSYPVLGDIGPLADTLYATAWRRDTTSVPLQATIGKRTDGGFADVINVTVLPEPFDWPDHVVVTPVALDGRATARFESPNSPYAGYAWSGTTSGGEIAIGDTPVADQLRTALEPGVGPDGAPTLSIGTLPAGYEVIDGPTLAAAAYGPGLSTDSGTAEGLSLMLQPALVAPPGLTATAVGGQTAFQYGPVRGADGVESAFLYWRAPGGWWAVLTGRGEFASRLVEIAEDVTWVGFDEFVRTYDANPADFEAGSPLPTTAPRPSTTTARP